MFSSVGPRIGVPGRSVLKLSWTLEATEQLVMYRNPDCTHTGDAYLTHLEWNTGICILTSIAGDSGEGHIEEYLSDSCIKKNI